MQTALLFGPRGMLGSEVLEEFKRRGGWNIVAAASGDIADVHQMKHLDSLVNPDVVVNCAGVIPQSARWSDPTEVIRVNSIGPHVLARTFRRSRVIHVSTDCVFGVSNVLQHRPTDTPDAVDLYGRSKALGESDEIIVVRTSFVGHEHGLLWWLEHQPADTTVPGWGNAMWSGSTVYEVARRLVDIAEDTDGDPMRVEHLATAEPISKYELLCGLRDALGLRLNIQPQYTPVINRTLVPTITMERDLSELSSKRSHPRRP